MSVQVDCPGCAWGNHDKHQWDWGIIPGLIGGQSCGCQGDCPQRFAAGQADFDRIWGAK